MLDPDSLDPRDFDLIEGLTATLVDPDEHGLEIVWRDDKGGSAAHAVVIFKGVDVLWTEFEVVDRWKRKGLATQVVANTPKLFRRVGYDGNYLIEATAPGVERFFIDRGFVREGDMLVGSTAAQGRLVRTAKGRLA